MTNAQLTYALLKKSFKKSPLNKRTFFYAFDKRDASRLHLKKKCRYVVIFFKQRNSVCLTIEYVVLLVFPF